MSLSGKIKRVMTSKRLLPFFNAIVMYKVKGLRTYSIRKNSGGVIFSACDNYKACGGLCDRLHLILSMYLYAKEAKLPYKIHFINPFKLQDYLAPNKVDWLTEGPDYAHSELLYVGYDSDRMGGWHKYKAWNDKYIRRLVRPTLKHPIVFWGNVHAVPKDDFRTLFDELFTPTQAVQREIDSNLGLLGDDFIGITTRFQNLLGDFKELDINPLNEKEQESIINRCITKIEHLHRDNPSKKVLVTSDSRKFLQCADRLEYVYTIPGKLIHMAFTFDSNYDAYIKGFVDLFVLSHSKKIFLISTGDMYCSTFPQTAAFLGNVEYYNIVF